MAEGGTVGGQVHCPPAGDGKAVGGPTPTPGGLREGNRF